MLTLNTPIEQASKIRRSILPALNRLGIKTLRDLLFHFPARYDDFSNLKPIGEVGVGEVVTVSGKIKKVQNYRTARRRFFITEVLLEDGSGSIKATWFNQPFLARNFRPGVLVSLSGKVVSGPRGQYLQNPAYEKITNYQLPITSSQGVHPVGSQPRRDVGVAVPLSAERTSNGVHTGGLVAIYPETEGVTSRWLRFLIKFFIGLSQEIEDPLPLETRQRQGLLEIKEALRAVHFPQDLKEAERANYRFGFQGLFLIQLRALQEKFRLKQYQAPAIFLNLALLKKFVSSLPYDLTDAQRRSIWEIAQDLAKSRPMNRLLEGDVGSGKTIVAAAASLLCVKSGFRIAFMAPTEILAQQHFMTLQKALLPFEVTVGLLTGAHKKNKDNSGVLVGTHALIQKNVKLEKLALVVVDEQHRFGVRQRADLGKNNQPNFLPHFLSMSATPIPRTLALTIYGDLDLSILDEMPKFRKEIITKIIEPAQRNEAYNFIKKEVQKGRQAFVICPRIEIPALTEEAKSLQRKLLWAEVKAVKEEYKKLAEEIFSDFKVGMLHGKMKSKEKEEVMRRFKDQEIDILVSTSVIEVGVDISNATVMMIEGAERFGLAQLHQFRGRVGRGVDQSYCFLFPSEDGLVTKRLRAVVDAKNGFELAEKDLEIRGPGDIFGIRQWGVSNTVLTAITNPKIVREVRKEAVDVIKKDPFLKKFPALQKSLAEAEKVLHLE